MVFKPYALVTSKEFFVAAHQHAAFLAMLYSDDDRHDLTSISKIFSNDDEIKKGRQYALIFNDIIYNLETVFGQIRKEKPSVVMVTYSNSVLDSYIRGGLRRASISPNAKPKTYESLRRKLKETLQSCGKRSMKIAAASIVERNSRKPK